MAKASSVLDVILGEAGGKTDAERYQDMQAIASVIVNRAAELGVAPEDVVSVRSEFNAYGKALPAGVEKYRSLAEQALTDVLDNGPVHNAKFYATPAAKGNLPSGLSQVASTGSHVYFDDPQNRSIKTAAGYATPDPSRGFNVPDRETTAPVQTASYDIPEASSFRDLPSSFDYGSLYSPAVEARSMQNINGLDWNGRELGDVAGVTVHHTGGRSSPQGVVDTLNERGLGAQYVMDRDGTIYSTVPEGASVSHMRPSDSVPGLSNRNMIGIEVIANDDADVTDAQRQAGVGFINDMKAQYPGIGENVYGQGELNPGHKEATEGMSIVGNYRDLENAGFYNDIQDQAIAAAPRVSVPDQEPSQAVSYAEAPASGSDPFGSVMRSVPDAQPASTQSAYVDPQVTTSARDVSVPDQEPSSSYTPNVGYSQADLERNGKHQPGPKLDYGMFAANPAFSPSIDNVTAGIQDAAAPKTEKVAEGFDAGRFGPPAVTVPDMTPAMPDVGPIAKTNRLPSDVPSITTPSVPDLVTGPTTAAPNSKVNVPDNVAQPGTAHTARSAASSAADRTNHQNAMSDTQRLSQIQSQDKVMSGIARAIGGLLGGAVLGPIGGIIGAVAAPKLLSPITNRAASFYPTAPVNANPGKQFGTNGYNGGYDQLSDYGKDAYANSQQVRDTVDSGRPGLW